MHINLGAPQERMLDKGTGRERSFSLNHNPLASHLAVDVYAPPLRRIAAVVSGVSL
jgi:hypothetical protein